MVGVCKGKDITYFKKEMPLSQRSAEEEIKKINTARKKKCSKKKNDKKVNMEIPKAGKWDIIHTEEAFGFTAGHRNNDLVIYN